MKIFYLITLKKTCKQLKRMKKSNRDSCIAGLVADASSVEESDARRRRPLVADASSVGKQRRSEASNNSDAWKPRITATLGSVAH